MCLFCKIASKEIPSNIILETEDFLAFEDINPQAKTHVLVIPKQHVESFNDVTPSIMAGMTDFIHRLVLVLDVGETGYRLITNIGEDGCQEIKHLHFHLLAGEKIGPLRAPLTSLKR